MYIKIVRLLVIKLDIYSCCLLHMLLWLSHALLHVYNILVSKDCSFDWILIENKPVCLWYYVSPFSYTATVLLFPLFFLHINIPLIDLATLKNIKWFSLPMTNTYGISWFHLASWCHVHIRSTPLCHSSAGSFL